MPRPGPRKPSVTLRMAQSGLDYLDLVAAEDGCTRSDVVTAMLRYAREHEARWRPGLAPEARAAREGRQR